MKQLESVTLYDPKTLDEALNLLSKEETRGRLIAGGTDLMAQWKAGVPMPDAAISLLGIKELCYITEEDDTIIMGATATHWDIRNAECVQQFLPALAAAASQVGAYQIQNRGTIGGNVANGSPAGDLPAALLVTGGRVEVASLRGTRQIPLTEFFLGYRKIDLQPDELIVRFLLPKCPENAVERFRKIGTREAQAISKVMGACRVAIADGVVSSVAVTVGSVAPICIRLPKFEAWLTGKKLSAELSAEIEKRVSEEVTPIDDIRSTASYRKWVSGRLVRTLLITED